MMHAVTCLLQLQEADFCQLIYITTGFMLYLIKCKMRNLS